MELDEAIRLAFRVMWVACEASRSILPISAIELGSVVELDDGARFRLEWCPRGGAATGAAMGRRWSHAGLPSAGGVCGHVYLPGSRLARVVTQHTGGV